MIELQNENLTLHVGPLGAQMMELRSRHGTQFLWNGDAKYWRDRAPSPWPIRRCRILEFGICRTQMRRMSALSRGRRFHRGRTWWRN